MHTLLSNFYASAHVCFNLKMFCLPNYATAHVCTLLAWIHPFLQIILTMFILFFESSKCKSASMARNWINSVPQTAATTFAFSFVFILLLRCVHPPDKILEVDACPLGLVLQPLGHSRQDIGTFYRQKEGQTSCSLFELCSMFLDVFVVF